MAYDNTDFLIQSKYVAFGIYLDVKKDARTIEFNNEILPHVHIGSLLEEAFLCKSKDSCTVVLVMKIQDFAKDVRLLVEEFTGSKFPASGNFAVSVNSSISSKKIALSSLRLIPNGIRSAQEKCGVCAIGFFSDEKDKNLIKKQILLSPDNLLRNFFSVGLINKKIGGEE